MIDKKTKKPILISRKKYLQCKRDILNLMHDIDVARDTIKIMRPILVAYALRDSIDYKKYPTYDKWLIDEYLGGEDYEDLSYSHYADVLVQGIAEERDKLEEDANK